MGCTPLVEGGETACRCSEESRASILLVSVVRQHLRRYSRSKDRRDSEDVVRGARLSLFSAYGCIGMVGIEASPW